MLSLETPNNYGYLCRRTFESLRKSTLRTFFDICPPKLIKTNNRGENWVEFVNGSIVQFGDLENTEKLKSMNLGWFAIDEASEANKDHFLILASRLRLSRPNIRYFGLLASNPAPGWLKDDFILEQKPNYKFIRSLPSDNHYLPEDYTDMLRASADDDWIKRYLEGDWSAFEGQIYNFRDIHIVKPFPIPDDWECYRGIDLGENHPTAAVWIGVSPDDTWYIYDEYKERNRATEEHAEEIISKTGKRRIRGTVLDENGLGKQLLLDYNKYGMRAIGQRHHSVTDGINRVKEKLKLNYYGKPSLYVFSTCGKIIKEFQTYQWDPKRDEGQPEKPLKINDDLMDSLRNFAMTFYYRKTVPLSEREEQVYVPEVSSITGY